MNFVIDQTLIDGSQLTGDGSAHASDWANTQDFIEGRLYLDCTAIDGATTAAFTLDYANKDRSIVVASGQSITSITAAGQATYALTNLPAWVRINYTITNAKNASIKAVLGGRGRY